MKKVMFLVMMAVMPFVACSSDDDTSVEPTIDPIVGKWYQIEERLIVDGKETKYSMTACEKMDNFDIKNDGTITSTFYYTDANKECQEDGSEKINWISTAKGTYTFTFIEDDGYTTEVKLEGETLTEIYTYTSGDSKVQDIHVYSMTPDESGDDEGISQEDSIVGKWSLTDDVETMDGKVTSEPISDCEKKSWIEFKADGNGSSNFYDTNGLGECKGDDPANPFAWINKGSNIYGFSFNDDGEEVYTVDISGNTLKMTITSKDGEGTYSNTLTFKKVN